MLRAKSESDPVREVDSRAYAFAYSLRSRSDLPGDFSIPSAWNAFSHGVFFAREQAPRFRTPRYPPRVLLLGAHDLLLVTHPSEQVPASYIPIAEVNTVECAHFLLDAWLEIASTPRQFRLPYNGRDDDVIHEFVRELDARILQPKLEPAEAVHFGDEVSFAMTNAVARELNPGETILASIFLASSEQISRRWLFQTRSTTAAHWVGISNLRMLWFSDSVDGFRQPAGYRMDYVPLRDWQRNALRDARRFAIHFHRGQSWEFQWPSRYADAVAQFVQAAERLRTQMEHD